MGQLCGECGLYQPRKRMLTVDQKPAVKATSVIAVELGCGHIVGNAEYMEYQKKVAEISARVGAARLKLENDAKNDMVKAWATMKAQKEVSE